jgi:hypothetical protein
MLITILLCVLAGFGAIGLAVIALIFTLWYMENKR